MAIRAVKVDLNKLKKEEFFQGKNGALYLDLVLMDNRDGEDQYGNHGFVKQSFPKDKRTGKEPIIGNFRVIFDDDKPTQEAPAQSFNDADDIPF